MSKRLHVTLDATGDGNVTSHFNAFEMDGSDIPGMLEDCIAELRAELGLVMRCPANQPKYPGAGRKADGIGRTVGSIPATGATDGQLER